MKTTQPIPFVQIELTNHCNYRCPCCPQSQWRRAEFAAAPFDRPKGFMSFELYRRVVDEANEVAGEMNFSFFGEPMMHPEFLKFMEYLKNRAPQLSVVMNTNLSYATLEIFEKLIEIQLSDLRIGIDAATPETYDSVRPGAQAVDLNGAPEAAGRFETICGKAAYWFSLPDRRPTRHVFTVQSRNVHEMGAYVERWLPLLGNDDIILTKNVLTYGGKVTDPLIRPNPCNVWNCDMLTVDWTGRVSPCNLDTNMDLAIGSLVESSLLDLHCSDKRREMQALSATRRAAPCRTCVDANNWTRNLVFRKGDTWTDEHYELYCEPATLVTH